MAVLSNINDKFAVDSTGAIKFNGQVGTSGYILKSNGNTAPTWVDPDTVIGGPYLPLTGGTLTGNLAINGTNSLSVGGTLTVGGNNVVGFSGSWNGANMPGSRWNGYSVNGGEIVFQRDNPNSGQMSILVDGGYYAGENNGFYSLYSSNSYNSKAGFYADTSGVLQFNASAAFAGDVLVEDNLYLTDAGTVRGKIQLNSSDRDNLDIKAVSLGSEINFFTVDTLALTLDANQNATFASAVWIPDYIYHVGDADSKFGFGGNNNYNINLGGDNVLDFYQTVLYLKKPTEVISPLSVKTGNDLRLYRSDNATYARFNYAGSSVGLDIDDLNGDGINLQQAGVNKLRIETNGNATFAGDVEIAANLFSTGNNLKFHAAGTHVMNIDLNGKVYPNTHNAYDLGYSTSLAWRNLYLSGTATIPTIASNTNFTGDIYQYGSTFRTSSFINLLNNRNTKKYLETAYFTNGVSNQAVNIQFINAAHQGFYKITLSGSYSNQDISGKLTKVIPFGYNPNGSIWRTGNNQSEITIATGGVSTNFTIGNLAWDSTNSKFIIPIYKLTSTGNSVKILVEYLGGAANNLKDVTLSSNYTQAAPSPFNVRQYRNIRDRLGIGTTNPATKLEVNGGLIKVVDSGDTAFYGGDYVRVFGTQSYGFRNSAGSAIAQISLTGNSYFNGGNVGNRNNFASR